MKCAIEFRDPEPERARDLHRLYDNAIFRARGLKMRTPNIPSDDMLRAIIIRKPG